jgi:rubredoxin
LSEKAGVEERDDANEEQMADAKTAVDLDEERLGEQIEGKERWKDDETVSDKATCPECGEPVHNLRMTCPMCGHEYKDKEIDDEDAGTEFRAGSEIDDDEVGEQVKKGEAREKTKSSDDTQDDEDDG